MKTLSIALLLILALTGCEERVQRRHVELAIDGCKTMGGWEVFTPDETWGAKDGKGRAYPFVKRLKCANGAVLEVWTDVEYNL